MNSPTPAGPQWPDLPFPQRQATTSMSTHPQTELSPITRRLWLPGAVVAELDNDPRPYTGKRTRRDVITDVIVISIAIFVGCLTAIEQLGGRSLLLPLDLSLAGIGCIALLWRRRWPVALAVLGNLVSIPFSAVGGPAFLAIFTVAVHRPPRYAIGVGLLGIASATGNFYLVGIDGNISVALLANVLLTGGVVGWGISVRRRRQLLISLAERARHAESEQRERIAAARAIEREQLAREMHDVLAHRMSLLSVHAGALEYRPHASPEEVARAAGVIRSGVHQMLVDLREVITMLRADTDDLAVYTKSVSDIDELLSEARDAGAIVNDKMAVDNGSGVPGVTSRAAYRVVQEGLTNVRKHAGAVPVTVEMVGAPGDGLSITISQPINGQRVIEGQPERSQIPGTGTGLSGLHERVTLAGGTLTYGRIEHRFVLHAELPWQKGNIT